MRDSEYVTMIDPFTQKYGKWGALQALPAAVSEIFWSASILGALGSTLQVILNIDEKISIIMSAVIALGYTLLGGLISVAYTDVIQIFFIVFGLVRYYTHSSTRNSDLNTRIACLRCYAAMMLVCYGGIRQKVYSKSKSVKIITFSSECNHECSGDLCAVR